MFSDFSQPLSQHPPASDSVSLNSRLAELLQYFGGKIPAAGSLGAAQREFYDLLVTDLERHVLRTVGFNEELAITAIQHAWIKIFTTANSYDPKLASVKTWAKRLAGQCAIDELRKHYRDQERIVDLNAGASSQDDPWEPGLDSLACSLPGPDQHAQDQELQKIVSECIERLPAGKSGPNYKLAIRLLLEEDMSYSEMREVLSAQSARFSTLNAEQVRGWVRQAVTRMKACIGEKWGAMSSKGGK